jgi:hypothetical protein
MAQDDADDRGEFGVAYYDTATAIEAPSQAVAILQYALLACALLGLAGSLAMYASQE